MPYRIVRDQGDRDSLTLRQVLDLRMGLVLECANCRRVSHLDVIKMVERFGAEFTVGELRPKCRCRLCNRRAPTILMRENGVRGWRAWWPHPPLGRE